jgi:glutamate-1-semialdehyde 2,1-aminomutase
MPTDISFSESQRTFARAQKSILGGGQAHKRRCGIAGMEFPIIPRRAQGSRFWDGDGNEYIDYLCAYGPIVLGYADARVDAAAAKAASEGTIFNYDHPLGIQLAEKLCEIIPSAEMVAYFVEGSSSTAGAVKMARAVTGREKVLRCGYHGWQDWCNTGGRGVPQCVNDLTIGVAFGDLDAVHTAFADHAGEIACAIIEPDWRSETPREFLEGVKRAAHDDGALFILDEMKTGMRFSLAGFQGWVGIEPDLATWGKGIANGYPIAVVTGKREILEQVADVWVAGTFPGFTPSFAASLTTIAIMEETGGIERLWRQGQKLLDGLTSIVAETGLPAKVVGKPPMPFLSFEDSAASDRFYLETLKGGVYFHPTHVWFLTTSHSDADLDKTLEVALKAAKAAV